MFLEAIEHRMDSPYCHAIDEKTLVIRLRAKKGDIKECTLFYGDRAYPSESVEMYPVEMKCAATDMLFDYFEIELQSEYPRVCYYFKLFDGESTIYCCGSAFYDKIDCQRNEYFQFPYLRREDIARIPEWSKNAVIYQIFPDSFATGEKYITKTGKQVAYSDNITCVSKNGGTLKGIADNILYLADLGINCIYLTPIFAACHYHKYDTIDYFSIDPCFGTNEDFKEMVAKCHEKGIRVIIDGVFNHTGSEFFAFRDIIEKGESSRYKDWYYNINFPLCCNDKPSYGCFAYEKHMPKLNTGNPEVLDYFIRVGTYWIKEVDIDGWRLDVANEVDHCFWREFRKAVKAVKPDALLIGEIWEDAHSYLEGDQFDSTMNYRFSNICRDFFAEEKIAVETFDCKVNGMLMRYKKNITNGQMNLLDSHDVPRFLSKCGEDIRRLKLAVLFQMTFIGIPSIYYGDEKGFDGWQESEYRKPMEWTEASDMFGLYDYYKKLISIRKEYMPFILGEYKSLLKDNERGIYAYMRGYKEEGMIIIINNSDSAAEVELAIPSVWSRVRDILNGVELDSSKGMISLNLQPKSGAVIVRGK